MKRFDIRKTVQLLLLVALTFAALLTVLRDRELYALIAANRHIRLLAVLLWLTLGLSFAFLFHDFSSYAELRRENLELDNAVYSDALTGVNNRYSVDMYISRFLGRPLPPDMGCVTLEITNLSELNESLGHGGGDEAIRAFSELLQSAAGRDSFIGRNGGNKFLAIFRKCSRERLAAFLAAVEKQGEEYNARHADARLCWRSGSAFDEGESVHSLTELIALSDRRAWAERDNG